MKIVLFFLLASFLFSGVSPLFGNTVDLMAMKKQEDARRKKIAKSKIAVSDTNLNSVVVEGRRYGFVQMESDEPVPEDAVVSPTSEKGSSEDVSKQPDYWQKQLADLQQRIAKLKEDIDAGQLDLNKLWSDFYIKNIPAEQAAIRVQIS
jgi:hypothetical protein